MVIPDQLAETAPKAPAKWLAYRIGMFPLPLFVLLAAILVTLVLNNAITPDAPVVVAVLAVGGSLCAWIGGLLPWGKRLGAPALTAAFLPSYLVYRNWLPRNLAKNIAAFTTSTNFIYLFITAIIVGCILGMNRSQLASGIMEIFVPLLAGSTIAAASPRVFGLQLGFADLLEPLGIASDNHSARQQIRLLLRLAAAEAGVPCYEAAYPFLQDHEGFAAQLATARSLGYAGASCLHPGQIEAANRVFSPTPEEVASAQAVVVAAEEAERAGSAVAMLNGKMIDRPFIARARAILLQCASSANHQPAEK